MAFGVKRDELNEWKSNVLQGNIAFLTHFWLDDRYPDSTTVTKAGSSDIAKLAKWGEKYGLKKEWIHHRTKYPHFDLMGEKQLMILKKEKLFDHIKRFKLK
ncbi:hypothetical protein ABES25_02890 [Bacillus gobiensis]|uniref:hypothetical protein n=1 Tax=Bacillus gobiensis TaxID=1441095 RepID=UPI003D21A1AA